MQQTGFVISFDVDPDANIPIAGRMHAGSHCSKGKELLFDSVLDGTRECLDLCSRFGLSSTWFLEARTAARLAELGLQWCDHREAADMEIACHSLEHEDFTGKHTGVKPDTALCVDVVAKATTAIERLTGTRPAGFRAPYNAVSADLIEALIRCGYRYDSSIRQKAGDTDPFKPGNVSATGGRRLPEIYLPQLCDPDGKRMSCYLWPFFEGKRAITEYLWFVEEAIKVAHGGLVQLAIHPWHIGVSARGIPYGRKERAVRLKGLEWLFAKISSMSGLHFTTIGNFCSTA